MELVTSCGAKVIVDDDFDTSKMRWKIYLNKRGYAYTQSPGVNHMIAVHHLVIGKKPGYVVDHINGNRLDNRKDNLRFVTHRENGINRSVRGYFIVRKGNMVRYRVRILINKKPHHVGYYGTAEEAAAAYKKFYDDLGESIKPRVRNIA